MKTSLTFDGPSDLSLGQIRISGTNGVVREWMATPERRSLTAGDFEPGYYMAEIAPAGVSPRSVVFEVQEGQANTVAVPDFAFLAANGSGTTFVGVEDQMRALETLFGQVPREGFKQAVEMTEMPPGSQDAAAGTKTEEGEAARPYADTRRISVGLSLERLGKRESWTAFPGTCTANSGGNTVSLAITPPPNWMAGSGQRARLTVTVEGVRIERLLLPLYRGGTSVQITASPVSANGLMLEVTPTDPAIRALWRAVDAGTLDHAAAVRDHVLRVKGPKPIAALEAADPWEAMLAGLLYLRFPEEFGLLSASWAEALCTINPWAADCYIIRAKQAAAAAVAAPETACENAELAVKMLVAAQARGSPYFTLANQLFNELLESLFWFQGLGDDARRSLERVAHRWQRELPLQRALGMSFSWTSRDQAMLKHDGILAPNRNPSGRLQRRDTTVVFKGIIKAGVISFETPSTLAPKRASAQLDGNLVLPKSAIHAQSRSGGPEDCPALGRAPTVLDDPNKWRFGGCASVGGFTLSSQFRSGSSRWVVIQLTVTAASPATVSAGDSVWFCLHPTFNPEWVRVFFAGSIAKLTVRAWGGFTVGAWLSSQRIELEHDLATAVGAPRLIRLK